MATSTTDEWLQGHPGGVLMATQGRARQRWPGPCSKLPPHPADRRADSLNLAIATGVMLVRSAAHRLSLMSPRMNPSWPHNCPRDRSSHAMLSAAWALTR